MLYKIIFKGLSFICSASTLLLQSGVQQTQSWILLHFAFCAEEMGQKFNF